jgi:hypothetical protein
MKNSKLFLGLNNDKLKQSRMISFKSKYFDGKTGDMKNVNAINSEEIFSSKKKK